MHTDIITILNEYAKYKTDINSEIQDLILDYQNERGGFGYSCGLSEFDRIKGFYKKFCYNFFADSGVGKSCVFSSIMLGILNENKDFRILYVSIDMSARDSFKLLTHITSGISDEEMIDECNVSEKKRKIEVLNDHAAKLLFEEKIEILDGKIIKNVSDIRKWYEALASQKGFDAIFIDYFQLLIKKGEGSYESSDDVANLIKDFAEEKDIICFMNSQVNKDGSPAHFQSAKQRSEYLFEIRRGGVSKETFESLQKNGWLATTLFCAKGRYYCSGEELNFAFDKNLKRIVDLNYALENKVSNRVYEK